MKPVEGSSILLTIIPVIIPQQKLIKGTTMTFLGNGHTYSSKDSDLSYFITKARFDSERQNDNFPLFSFFGDVELYYDLWSEKSNWYSFNKKMTNYYVHQQYQQPI